MAPKVSEEYKLARRHDLLAHALQCFGRKGYAATTVDDIVRAAGVSKGALYTYFAGKEDIFLTLLQDRTERYFAGMEARLADQPTAAARLLTLLRYYRDTPLTPEVQQWMRVYIEFWLSASADRNRRKVIEARYQRYVSFLVRIVEAGQAAGEFNPDVDAWAAAALFWSVLDGLQLHFSQVGDRGHQLAVWTAAEAALTSYLRT